VRRNRERITVRGLNDNHNRALKNRFKSAAISASPRPGPLYDFYVALLEKGMRPTMARLISGPENGRDQFNHWEERSGFRPQTVAAASSLSLSGEAAFPSLGILSGGWLVGFWRRSVRGRVSVHEIGPECFGTESLFTRYAPSDNQK
jgi:hypothetical protein